MTGQAPRRVIRLEPGSDRAEVYVLVLVGETAILAATDGEWSARIIAIAFGFGIWRSSARSVAKTGSD